MNMAPPAGLVRDRIRCRRQGEDCMMLVEPGKRNIRQRTAFAIEDCELAFLSKSNADKIAEQHPEMLTSFQNLASRKACVEHERLNMSDPNALFIRPVPLSKSLRRR